MLNGPILLLILIVEFFIIFQITRRRGNLIGVIIPIIIIIIAIILLSYPIRPTMLWAAGVSVVSYLVAFVMNKRDEKKLAEIAKMSIQDL